MKKTMFYYRSRGITDKKMPCSSLPQAKPTAFKLLQETIPAMDNKSIAELATVCPRKSVYVHSTQGRMFIGAPVTVAAWHTANWKNRDILVRLALACHVVYELLTGPGLV